MVGFSQNLVNLIPRELATVPRISPGAYSTMSQWESGDGTNTSLTHHLAGNFSKLQGQHNLKFGVDFRAYRS